ncbi:MAG: N-acetylneuraminate synthase family protein [Candidatus Yanofskybacteria bacterium]|nr:N-acetylneuraminate synthase family protein [Candidatus Yanofskybacteria bacterium]
MADFPFLKHFVRQKVLKRLPHRVKLGHRYIGDDLPVFVIAEIGVNHEGDMQRAKELIDAAKKAGADCVKFQKREIKEIYTESVLQNPEKQEWGTQYLMDVLNKVELPKERMRELKQYAEAQGLMFLVTPFDEASAEFVASLGVHMFKTASADLTNTPLIEKIAGYGKPVIMSTGMSTPEEIDEAVSVVRRHGAPLILLHCQSAYPANIDDLNLRLIPHFRQRYGVPVGYSGHERDVDPSVTAVAMGASVVERHITYDKNATGPDHAASLNPDEFAELVAKIRKVERVKGRKAKVMSAGEVLNRMALAKSLVATVTIPQGTTIVRSMVAARSPAKGLSPQRLGVLLGRRLDRVVEKDDFFLPEDLESVDNELSIPHLSSQWGFKTRFHDLEEYRKHRPRLLEFHMTAKDLDLQLPAGERYDQQLYLHAPEYYGEQVVDLCSYDDRIWNESIALMQRTIDKARELAPHFSGTPKVVIHVGGMSLDPVGEEEAKKLVYRSIDAFKKLDATGVELLPENLPALAWYFAGQWYQNCFVRADEIITLCKELGLKMCLDTSHAWLAANYHGFDFYEFVRACAPYVAHMHIADGAGVNGEGLQVGEGEIDFDRVFSILKHEGANDFSWVPEIWRGHLYAGRGFLVALNRLQKQPLLK